MRPLGISNEPNSINKPDSISIKSYQVSCKSDRPNDPKINVVGIVLYSKNAQTHWYCNGVHCKTGYIILRTLQPGPINLESVTAHYGEIYQSVFKCEPNDIIGSGFSRQNGAWKFDTYSLNATKNGGHEPAKHIQSEMEQKWIKKAIENWMYNGRQNTFIDECELNENDKLLNYEKLEIILESAKRINKIRNPFIIILSTKSSDTIFDENDNKHPLLIQTLKPENYSIISKKTHKYIKESMVQIINDKFNDIFDGIIVILLCVIDRNHNDEATFFYDTVNEKRHIDKLKEDIIYRLEDKPVYIHYNNTAVINFVDNEQIEAKTTKEKEQKEVNAEKNNKIETSVNHQNLTKKLDDRLWSEIDQILDEEVQNIRQNEQYLPFMNELFIEEQKIPQKPHQPKKSKKKKSKRKKKATISNEGGQYEPMSSHRARGNIRISRTLTEEIIPNKIMENVNNVWNHMDRTTALQLNDQKINNKKNEDNMQRKILNYDFHDKETGETLYCIIDKIGDGESMENGGYKWKMVDMLYTAKELEHEHQIKEDKLPPSSREKQEFKLSLENEHRIKKELSKMESMHKFINNTPWHKIVVFKRKNNTRRMTLSMNKQRFIKNCLDFVNNSSMDKFTLIPILMFNNNICTHWIELVWIISVDINVDIGVSMRLNDGKIEVTGLHLDKEYLQIQHELVSFHYGCHCLDNFKTNINDLTVGNPDNQLNQLKHYKQKYEQFKGFVQEFAETNDDHQSTVKSMQKQAKELVAPSGASTETKSGLILPTTKPTVITKKDNKNKSNKKLNSTLNAGAAEFNYEPFLKNQQMAMMNLQEENMRLKQEIKQMQALMTAKLNNNMRLKQEIKQQIRSYPPILPPSQSTIAPQTQSSIIPQSRSTDFPPSIVSPSDQAIISNNGCISTQPLSYTNDNNIFLPSYNNMNFAAPTQNNNTFYPAYYQQGM